MCCNPQPRPPEVSSAACQRHPLRQPQPKHMGSLRVVQLPRPEKRNQEPPKKKPSEQWHETNIGFSNWSHEWKRKLIQWGKTTRLALIFIFERSTGVYFRVFLGYFIVLPQRTQEPIESLRNVQWPRPHTSYTRIPTCHKCSQHLHLFKRWWVKTFHSNFGAWYLSQGPWGQAWNSKAVHQKPKKKPDHIL